MAKPKLDSPKVGQAKINIPIEILPELLTPSEIQMLKNRWQIINLLEDGLSVRNIAEKVSVGTDTVVRVARMLEKSSLRHSLSRTKSRDSGSSTPWVFGKSE